MFLEWEGGGGGKGGGGGGGEGGGRACVRDDRSWLSTKRADWKIYRCV